jgi:acyl carrier protein
MMTNRDKLKQLVIDVFILSESQFNFELKRDEVANWDSLGTISLAVGVQETFGYHFTPDEAIGISSVRELIITLESKGVSFSE